MLLVVGLGSLQCKATQLMSLKGMISSKLQGWNKCQLCYVPKLLTIILCYKAKLQTHSCLTKDLSILIPLFFSWLLKIHFALLCAIMLLSKLFSHNLWRRHIRGKVSDSNFLNTVPFGRNNLLIVMGFYGRLGSIWAMLYWFIYDIFFSCMSL